ncbi:MAG: HD domain-containing phosphohydrolase [Clostridia bacterium]
MKNSIEVKNVKILIVDDSPEEIDVLGSILPVNCICQIALNGEKALQLLSDAKILPDLVLLDVIMPGMGGYEVCKRIKGDAKLKNIPIIFVSALGEAFDKVKAFELGGVDYITKPFQCEEVRARINTQLNLHNLQQQLAEANKSLSIKLDERTEEVIDAQMATIYALAKLAESRDDDTGGHLERVQNGCRLLAAELSKKAEYKNILTAEVISVIEKASLLHDIGKVGIKDSILLKPGKLTDTEFEEIKKHTLIGEKTLSEVVDKYPQNKFTKTGFEIARSHHEKWNGKGYPDGLAGEAIPIAARIVALADAYDAIRTKRPYKEALSHEISRNIIIKDSGSHFDPTVVEGFLACEQEFIAMYNE